MTGVVWKNGHRVTYQKSNGNWIIRDSKGKKIGIYKKTSKQAKYLTTAHVSKKKSKKKSSSSSGNSSSSGSSSSSSGSSSTDSSSSSTDTSSTDSSSTDSSSTDSGVTSQAVEIDNFYEALRFAKKYANMTLREDAHTIECKVIGGENWKIGEWCKVKIPSFQEESTMFIEKCSNELSASDENISSLTLVDFPPSLSAGSSNGGATSSSTDSTGSTDGTSGTGSSTGDSSNTGSTGSSSSSGSGGSSSSKGSSKSTRKSSTRKTSKKSKKKTTYKSAYKGMNRKNNKSTDKSVKNPTGRGFIGGIQHSVNSFLKRLFK